MKVLIETFVGTDDMPVSRLQHDIETDNEHKRKWFFGHLMWACHNNAVVEISKLTAEDEAAFDAEFRAKKLESR